MSAIRALIFDFDGLTGPLPDRNALQLRRDARKTELTLTASESAGLRALLSDGRQRGLRLGVCSSSTPRWVVGHLERLGLATLFDHIQCRDRAELRAKPAPDLYLAACAGLGVRPDEAIAFEDSRNGMLAAQAAGMRCVVVPNELTVAMDLSGADGVSRSRRSRCRSCWTRSMVSRGPRMPA